MYSYNYMWRLLVRAEVIMLTIPCFILFRISCNSSALCSNFYIILKIIVKTIHGWEFLKRYLNAKHDYSIRVIIMQLTSLIMC